MSNLKDSIVLMGIDWSKAAKLKAIKDISCESPEVAEAIADLHSYYTRRKN